MIKIPAILRIQCHECFQTLIFTTWRTILNPQCQNSHMLGNAALACRTVSTSVGKWLNMLLSHPWEANWNADETHVPQGKTLANETFFLYHFTASLAMIQADMIAIWKYWSTAEAMKSRRTDLSWFYVWCRFCYDWRSGPCSRRSEKLDTRRPRPWPQSPAWSCHRPLEWIQHSTTQYSIAHHSTLQQRTAHNTTQHSTSQHTTAADSTQHNTACTVWFGFCHD